MRRRRIRVIQTQADVRNPRRVKPVFFAHRRAPFHIRRSSFGTAECKCVQISGTNRKIRRLPVCRSDAVKQPPDQQRTGTDGGLYPFRVITRRLCKRVMINRQKHLPRMFGPVVIQKNQTVRRTGLQYRLCLFRHFDFQSVQKRRGIPINSPRHCHRRLCS